MTYPHGGARQIWRDAGAYNPLKPEIRDWGGEVERRIVSLQEQAFSADPIFDSVEDAMATRALGDQFKVKNSDPLIAFSVYEYTSKLAATLITDVPAGAALSDVQQKIDAEATARKEAITIETAARVAADQKLSDRSPIRKAFARLGLIFAMQAKETGNVFFAVDEAGDLHGRQGKLAARSDLEALAQALRSEQINTSGFSTAEEDVILAFAAKGSGASLLRVDAKGNGAFGAQRLGLSTYCAPVGAVSRVGFITKDHEKIPVTHGERNAYSLAYLGSGIRWLEQDADGDLAVRHQGANFAFPKNADVTEVSLHICSGQSLMQGASHQAVRYQSGGYVSEGRAFTFNPFGSEAILTGGVGGWTSKLPERHLDNIYNLKQGDIPPGNRIAKYFLRDKPASTGLLTTNVAVGGLRYDQLRKGPVEGFVWENTMRAIDRALLCGAMSGVAVRDLYFSWIHGHANKFSMEKRGTYKDYMADILADITAEWALRNPSGNAPLMCLSQYCSNSSADIGTSVAQFEAAMAHSQMIMACPEYMLAADVGGVHLQGTSYAYLGAYHGRAMAVGSSWKPLHMASANRTGTAIDITFDGGVGDIVFDAYDPADGPVVMGARSLPNKGFTWHQEGGDPVSINSVSITGPRTVRLTLTGDPGATTHEEVRLGFVGTGSPFGFANNDPRQANGNATNVRTESTITDDEGRPLHDWAVLQNIAL